MPQGRSAVRPTNGLYLYLYLYHLQFCLTLQKTKELKALSIQCSSNSEPATCRRRWFWSTGGMIMAEENRSTGRKHWNGTTSSTTNLTRTGLGLNSCVNISQTAYELTVRTAKRISKSAL